MELKEIFLECIKRGIQQRESDFLPVLKMIVDRKYKTLLEIGAYSGGCTYAYSQLCDKVVTVDLEHRGKEKFDNVFYICGDSHSETIIEKVKAQGKFDVIFIDGDHTYEGVKMDYEYYKDMLNDGGIICFHDIWESEDCIRQNCHVYKLWNELKVNHKYLELGDVKTWGGIGAVGNV
jgi:predicted O-methyltransferase YrrM